MKKIYVHFFRILLFYLLLFFFARFLFIVVNRSDETGFSWLKALPAFLHGMRMDISVVAYVFLPVLFLLGLFLIHPMNWMRKVEYYYHLFILFLFFWMLPANILLYHFWGSLLNFRSLSYLKDFSEISASFNLKQLILGVLALSIFFILIFYCFKKYSFRILPAVIDKPPIKLLGYLGLISLTVISIRGGLQKLPMNESLISFSENNFINQSAINPAWHLANDVYRAGIFEGNPFENRPLKEAEEIVKKLYLCDKDSFPEILTNFKPNIVFIILESFTADIVEQLGGEKGVTPSLNNLIQEGIFFNSIYASGTRTDQGIVSLLNGWPATPYYSIMRSTEKSNKLPSLPKTFLEKGYSTSFYYGGESNFSNLNVYCINQEFQSIIDKKNFADSIDGSGWGVADEYVFNRHLTDLSATKEPFFSTLMTLSSHEPFVVPGPTRFPGEEEADKFRNSVSYTDAMLGDYIMNAKNKPWFKNTLFIIAADHGHHLPRHTNVYYPESHRIPLLFYGEVIKPEFRGAIVTKLGGHHDLAGTLLPQLRMKEADMFEWSKNLLNPTVNQFAYYQIDHLLGWVDQPYWFGYSYNRNKFIARSYSVSKEKLEVMKVNGQAFVQVLFDRYRKY